MNQTEIIFALTQAAQDVRMGRFQSAIQGAELAVRNLYVLAKENDQKVQTLLFEDHEKR
jgi:hypothetical protein